MVKALFPIGKTQWAKWCPEQQIAFNEARASGVPFPDAVDYVNRLELIPVNIAPQPEPKHKKNIFDKIEDVVEDVADVATTVGSVTAAVSPVLAVAKAVAKATKKKAK